MFTTGRRDIFKKLKQKISAEDQIIWFHAASLGEYEQAVPVIRGVKSSFPNKKILVTFFSPSGYEIKKKNSLADITSYLPLDTKENVRQFLDVVHPEWALFIKYEFWPNYLKELKRRNVRTLLISGCFREDQIFFKNYGSWMRKSLDGFDHFFVQNEKSFELLTSLGIRNITVSGDTRFDRVAHQIEQDNTLDFVDNFRQDKLCMVAGSTWPEDEELLVDFINNSSEGVKFIIAPHTLKKSEIKQLQQKLQVSTILFSEKQQKNLSAYKVMILDTIGLLTKVYSYADISYVGGAAGKTGLHNILEPATFGVPVIIGSNFSRFPEAVRLRQLAGLYSVNNKKELAAILGKMISDKEFREKTGMIAGHFINSNTGATKAILDHLQQDV